jgi:uncharacterized protein (TIGR02270 family)
MANVIPVVLAQHVETAVHLAGLRPVLLSAPHVALRHLARSDERLDAHLDGLIVAGSAGTRALDQSVEETSAASVFVGSVCALSDSVDPRIDRFVALCDAEPGWLPGLTMACGWVEPRKLQGLALRLLDSTLATQRLLGLAACAWHRVDPGVRLTRSLEDVDSTVRARALRTSGELGRSALLSTCTRLADDSDLSCRFWGAWSAVLLGDRRVALEMLASISGAPGPFQERAFSLVMQAMPVAGARDFLRSAPWGADETRRLIRGAGLVGDPTYIPWLIGLMSDDSCARIAGEAFSLITGVDLALLDLERKPPGSESGPNDDPNDANVGMDEDDGLPWPDAERVKGWWDANAQRFQSGVRHFMGESLNPERCLQVLRAGYQRQRIAAALYLPLLNPGSSLFEWRAPAQRQKQLLAS